MEREVTARFVIVCRDDPDEITKLLGTAPDETWRDGDPIPGSTSARKKDNGWVVESRLATTDSLEPHLDDLLARVEPIAARLKALPETAKTYVSFGVTLAFGDSVPSIFFRPDQLSRLGDLGAELGVDVVCISMEIA